MTTTPHETPVPTPTLRELLEPFRLLGHLNSYCVSSAGFKQITDALTAPLRAENYALRDCLAVAEQRLAKADDVSEEAAGLLMYLEGTEWEVFSEVSRLRSAIAAYDAVPASSAGEDDHGCGADRVADSRADGDRCDCAVRVGDETVTPPAVADAGEPEDDYQPSGSGLTGIMRAIEARTRQQKTELAALRRDVDALKEAPTFWGITKELAERIANLEKHNRMTDGALEQPSAPVTVTGSMLDAAIDAARLKGLSPSYGEARAIIEAALAAQESEATS